MSAGGGRSGKKISPGGGGSGTRLGGVAPADGSMGGGAALSLDGEHIRELARLTSERDQLNGERIALTEEVSQMRASTSWRMTAPLRSLVHRFRHTTR